jgi:DNA-binding SARP family transcriptional activator
MRERLRTRFVRLVDDVAQQHEAAGRLDEAIACYRRGVEVDLLAESFYQGMMRCLAQQDRRAEGAAVYRQLRQTLSVVLGIAPSPQSEQLGRTLLGQA